MNYTIEDPLTKSCVAAMRANGGKWNGRCWTFSDPAQHGNAAACLYRAYLDRLPNQIDELLAHLRAGVIDKIRQHDPLDADDIQMLTPIAAAALLAEAREARKVLGYRLTTTGPAADHRQAWNTDFDERSRELRARQRPGYRRN